ncbi:MULTISPECIES: YciC family protein [Edwardsiella]|uniref:UPF0259 membrane protein ETEE_3530 n=2 Tax=Edwardsiella anguillarum TaxID=1821960 RepID=A0A076LPV8_9GAMM|nr:MULTISPECIES: YciC family protein [Edwardsiella]GAJ68427.1 membrane protein YciC [Edwardsiella piscicida]AIJ09951.1 Membrane protein YciC, linked to IspA [Edwardsiella anguillarum ET080813]AKR77606.1 envelope biogenesis factor ElyC [Edwardsiella sp. LADL05-105]KAB0588274.1 UPF0259 family protein [Edwardsiella anguillarum]RFT03813.1 UPF0259 family protein [Edwardsiella anguillarum]
MPITARSLYRDSVNFFRHQLTPIVLLALLTAFISVMLNQALSPSAQAISQLSSGDGVSAARGLQEMIRQMTPEQQMTLLKVSAASSFSVLIGNVLLLGGMLTLIPQASTGVRLSALRAIGLSAPMLPRLLLLMLLCTLMVQLGITLFILPGIILAVGLALSPMIMTTERCGVIAAIRSSFRLSFASVRLISPAILLWMLMKLVLLLLVDTLAALHPSLGMVIMGTLSNLISVGLIIYLSRLYMLLRTPA